MARETFMSRKHYELLGNCVNAMMLEPQDRLHVANMLATALSAQPGFDPVLFVDGCTRRDRKRATAMALGAAYGGGQRAMEKLTKRAVAEVKIENFNPSDPLPARASPGRIVG